MEEKYNINHTTLKILALFTTDYQKTIHVRKIARNIQTDVKTVGIHLKRLEHNNILQSTTKGRNKEYNPNLNNQITKHYLILAETYSTITYLEKNFLIKKLSSEITDKVKGIIILFGSFAKGKADPESDIDLQFISDQKTDTQPIQETARLIDREINIITTTPNQFQNGLKENDPLIKEIIQNHIVIKGADRLVDHMWKHYAEQ